MAEQTIILAGANPLGGDGQRVVLDDKTGHVFDMSGKRIRHLALVPDDVHSAAEIPTYLAMYRNGAYRADDVSPVFPVVHRKDKYRNESADDAFLRVNTKGSIQGAIPQIDPKSSLTDYAAVEQFVGSYVPQATEDEEVGTRYRTRQAAARRCKNALASEREHDVWGLLTTSGNWDSGNVTTLLAAAAWNGGASSDPIKNIQDAMEDSAMEVTDVWMNRTVANAFVRHASVREHMKQFMGDGSASAQLQALNGSAATGKITDFVIPGLPPIRIVNAKSRSTAGGALGPILGSHVVLTSNPGGDDIHTTKTFRVKGSQGVGYESREFRVEDRGPQGGTMIVVAVSDVPKMIANNVGGLILNAVQ
jgi:hypothetical protein